MTTSPEICAFFEKFLAIFLFPENIERVAYRKQTAEKAALFPRYGRIQKMYAEKRTSR
jgi:hypothetical protein